jgi:endonuclease YncB( thermonuclease family)
MRRKRKVASSLIPILITAAAVTLWVFETYELVDIPLVEEKRSQQIQAQDPKAAVTKGKTTRTGKYESYSGCTLATDRSNDGDSFRVKLPDGRSEIIRLYFVDCPESAFKTYGGGRNNHERIAKQAMDLGRISSPQAVEIGKEAKKFSIFHLGKAPFTLHTKWDSPFNDKRYHGFIQINFNGKSRFLHELLVEKGYARIHTKGSQLPDGTSVREQEDHLNKLERAAKSSEAGAWGL